jgi:hypothetical protein
MSYTRCLYLLLRIVIEWREERGERREERGERREERGEKREKERRALQFFRIEINTTTFWPHLGLVSARLAKW